VNDDSLRGAETAYVARALGELAGPADAGDPTLIAALERLVAAPDPVVRAFAAEAFGALGDARSLARVGALGDDVDPQVRARARSVLRRAAAPVPAPVPAPGRFGGGDGPTLDDFAVLAAAAGAGHAGPLQPWLDDLADPRRAVRESAIAALVGAGRRAVPFLLDRLGQPIMRVRVAAAQALGRLQAPEATGPLLVAATAAAYTAEDAELRPVALRALASCLTGSEAGLSPSLLPLARDTDRFVRGAALLCLGRVAERAGIRAVALALFDNDPFVVESAAVALSEGIREDHVELVLPLLRALANLSSSSTTHAAVREAILIALGRIEAPEPAEVVRVRHAVRADVDAPTASARKAAIVLLERSFTSDDPPPLPLLDAVLARTADLHPDVRVVAASFVARHLPRGMTGAVDILARALARHERPLSLLCIEALCRHDTPEARAALLPALRDHDAVVSVYARTMLTSFRPSTTTWTAASDGSSASSSAAHRSRDGRPTADKRCRPTVDARFVDDGARGRDGGRGHSVR
jgi:HEAT repeat protein